MEHPHSSTEQHSSTPQAARGFPGLGEAAGDPTLHCDRSVVIPRLRSADLPHEHNTQAMVTIPRSPRVPSPRARENRASWPRLDGLSPSPHSADGARELGTSPPRVDRAGMIPHRRTCCLAPSNSRGQSRRWLSFKSSLVLPSTICSQPDPTWRLFPEHPTSSRKSSSGCFTFAWINVDPAIETKSPR
jgi:hypothetical protein